MYKQYECQQCQMTFESTKPQLLCARCLDQHNHYLLHNPEHMTPLQDRMAKALLDLHIQSAYCWIMEGPEEAKQIALSCVDEVWEPVTTDEEHLAEWRQNIIKAFDAIQQEINIGNAPTLSIPTQTGLEPEIKHACTWCGGERDNSDPRLQGMCNACADMNR